MKKEEVIKLIGKSNWKRFCEWMRGQTVGMNKDGSIDYYENDVKAFMRLLKTGYDRQKDPLAWD